MTETKFTRGPWSYADKGCVVAPDRDPVAFAAVVRMDNDDADGKWMGQATANAHLIAAAPDLYAALQEALHALDKLTDPNDAMTHGLAALAKARGETP